ncbi:MAG: hypothetical protein ABEJ26_04955 [Halosimplex sp.]
MTCCHCGDGTLTREYTLAFRLDDATKELDLALCTACLDELTSDPDVESATGAAASLSER